METRVHQAISLKTDHLTDHGWREVGFEDTKARIPGAEPEVRASPSPGQRELQTSAQVLTWAPETQRTSGEQFTARHIVMEHLGSFASAWMATVAATAITAITANSTSFFMLPPSGRSAPAAQ